MLMAGEPPACITVAIRNRGVAMRPPAVSVLLPAYNAQQYVLQSVQSILAQTFEDFELLIVDDCSTDATPAILASIADDRLRVIRNEPNLGVVGSLNRAMRAARGRYVARADADDFCLPTRFAQQAAFLDRNPDIALTGARMANLEAGTIRHTRLAADPDPDVLRFQFHHCNPLGHPSMMFRAEIVQTLGEYLREALKYAEDFDFSHRVLRRGRIAVLPERLVLYRIHQTNLTRTYRREMIARSADVLRPAYEALLGGDRGPDAALVAEHLMAAEPITRKGDLGRLGDLLESLSTAFTAAHGLRGDQAARVAEHAGRAWWSAAQNALRAGLTLGTGGWRDLHRFKRDRPPLARLARSAAAGLADRRSLVASRLGAALDAPARKAASPAMELEGTRFTPAAVRGDDPPSLYVVVDTEAEFDWSGAFDRSLTSVGAMAAQGRVQSIFDGYGLRPIYVIDYAVASQPGGYEPLREIVARHGCVVGAHLHPWINPPFEEAVSARNSFGGNLPPELEARKLRALVAAIRRNLGVEPMFFKAGRYGLGARTMQTLAELGFEVDLSIMPRSDMTAQGGVDFRRAGAGPYHAASGRVLSVPMTRARVGLLAGLPPRVHDALHSRPLAALRVPGLLARLKLVNTVTLTPEGVTAEEQIDLLRSMLRRGQRTFTLHYHSPSAAPGNTPYVRTEADLAVFLGRIRAVCRYFFDELGGMPGNPPDLLPPAARARIWPRAAADADLVPQLTESGPAL
jgi:GT2 family glycosyltransferase